MTTNNAHTHTDFTNYESDRQRFESEATGLLHQMDGYLSHGPGLDAFDGDDALHFLRHYGPLILKWSATFPTFTVPERDQ